MQVKDIMRRQFVSFHADDGLEFVVKAFARERITSAPVFEDGDYLGMISVLGLVQYFTPKKYVFLWKKDKTTPLDDMKKATARQLAKKSSVVLSPETALVDALPKIVKRPYSIAVIEKNKLVGIVREEDLTNFFLRELVKGEVAQSDGQEAHTAVDRLLHLVQSKNQISAAAVAKQLNLSVSTVEKFGKSLAKHHLIKMECTFFNGIIFRRYDHETK